MDAMEKGNRKCFKFQNEKNKLNANGGKKGEIKTQIHQESTVI